MKLVNELTNAELFHEFSQWSKLAHAFDIMDIGMHDYPESLIEFWTERTEQLFAEANARWDVNA